MECQQSILLIVCPHRAYLQHLRDSSEPFHYSAKLICLFQGLFPCQFSLCGRGWIRVKKYRQRHESCSCSLPFGMCRHLSWSHALWWSLLNCLDTQEENSMETLHVPCACMDLALNTCTEQERSSTAMQLGC